MECLFEERWGGRGRNGEANITDGNSTPIKIISNISLSYALEKHSQKDREYFRNLKRKV